VCLHPLSRFAACSEEMPKSLQSTLTLCASVEEAL
jgi:hypothetical protein